MSWIIRLVVPVVALAAAFAGGVVVGTHTELTGLLTGEGTPRADDARSADASDPNARWREPRRDGAPRPAREATEGFQLIRMETDTSGAAPKACLVFSRKLVKDGSVAYTDYVSVEGAPRAAATAEGEKLCLTGLEFDRDYRATVRAGLPAADGETLARGETVSISFGDKPAYVAFAGDGVILPRTDADGLGVETVNIDRLRVRVRRVGDRILAQRAIVEGRTLDEDDYFYAPERENGRDVGVIVYEGEFDVDGERNVAATTVFPLGAALESFEPGAYFVELADASEGVEEGDAARAWRWILFTDLALTTYQGTDGLMVVARSLKTAKPVSGVKVELIAANNDILDTAATDGDGLVRFAESLVRGSGPDRARMVMAYGKDADFAALDLDRAQLDLSDRGVGGRYASGDFDAYLYTDRGIYRPGERVFLTGLVRDAFGVAIDDRPGSVVISRPNGTEAARLRTPGLDLGGFSLSYDLPKSAPRGEWRFSYELDGAGYVGGASVSVEDFVPQTIEVKLDADDETPLKPGDTRTLRTDVRFLYGAPGSGLTIESEARLRLDPNPFPDYRGYRFGPLEGGFDQRFLTLPMATTDGDGVAEIPLEIDSDIRAAAPLRADIVVAALEPGGRAVRESARVPLRAAERYVGLRLSDGARSVGANDPAGIDLLLLNRDGAPVSGDLDWRLTEEDYWFDWYRSGGQWRWRRVYRDLPVSEGSIETAEDGTASLTRRLDYGTYRLTATDPATGAETTLRFWVGWRSWADGAAAPDEATLTAPETPVKPGETVTLSLRPPYAGEAMIVVASDRILDVKRYSVSERGREIEIETDPSWGAGVYVLATVVTPRSPADRPVPRRAMGVAYVPFDMGARTLEVELGAPELLRPRGELTLPVRIEGAAGERANLTIAAVDEGILRLTKHASPDPLGWYFGKKRLGVGLYDDYSRLLDPNLGAPAKFGGDQIGGEGLTVVPEKSVALFSGLVDVGEDGEAEITLDVPDFNGELRLMAVAWSETALGALAEPLTVRDEVPARLILPRFLAPGDAAQATLSIDNVEGAAGDYQAEIDAEGAAAADASRTLALDEGERKSAAVPIEGGPVGLGSVALSVSGPEGFAVSRRYDIQSRSPWYPERRSRTIALGAGESLTLSGGEIAGLAPSSLEASVSFSPLAGIEPGALIASLYTYPYGCTEQLVSSAMPLLLSERLAAYAKEAAPDRAERARVQDAVNQILDRQTTDGAFGLWRAGDRAASAWLAPYVVEFLEKAKASGRVVPDEALERAYASLRELSNADQWTYLGYETRIDRRWAPADSTEYLRRRAAAYSLYVLARAGKADLADLRYAHDAWIKKTPSPLARAQLGAALKMMGDVARANSAFALAEKALGYENRDDYYQSSLRDAAGAVAVALEAGEEAYAERFVAAMSASMKDARMMHTQEKAFLLLAADAMLARAGAVKVAGGAETKSGPIVGWPVSASAFDDGAAFQNAGNGTVYATVSAKGDPVDPPEATASGLAISKRILSRTGEAVDLAEVRQNDRLLIVVEVRPEDSVTHPIVIADLLPPGFEIETTLGPNDGADPNGDYDGPYAFAGVLHRAKIAEARDDRYVAAIDLRGEPRRLAYLVRAVTPGDFAMPGAVAEDMYRPAVFARSASGRVAIASAQ